MRAAAHKRTYSGVHPPSGPLALWGRTMRAAASTQGAERAGGWPISAATAAA